MRQLLEEENLLKLVDQLCTNLPMEYKQRQKCLETVDLQMRFEVLAQFMTKEIEMIQITREIQAKVKERVDKNQREYILREQMKVIREELGEDNTQSDAEQFEAQLKELEASDEVKKKFRKRLTGSAPQPIWLLKTALSGAMWKHFYPCRGISGMKKR